MSRAPTAQPKARREPDNNPKLRVLVPRAGAGACWKKALGSRRALRCSYAHRAHSVRRHPVALERVLARQERQLLGDGDARGTGQG